MKNDVSIESHKINYDIQFWPHKHRCIVCLPAIGHTLNIPMKPIFNEILKTIFA